MATLPNRTLKSGSRGDDVRLFQAALNDRLRARGRKHQVIKTDGVYGKTTAARYRTVGYLLGLAQSTLDKGATIGAQRIIRWPNTRTPVQLARAKQRARQNNWAPKPELTVNVRNQSSRNGQAPRIIVLHTTESHDRPGVEDIRGIINWFDNPDSQASSHVVNDKSGNDARLVPDERKSWTQSQFNSVALSIEQVAFARYSESDWRNERAAQLDNTARWIAYWSKKYGIPITLSTSHGVCEHRHLGRAGGGHHDCGEPYPLDFVLERARSYARR